jgi:hypothetical protein
MEKFKYQLFLQIWDSWLNLKNWIIFHTSVTWRENNTVVYLDSVFDKNLINVESPLLPNGNFT